MGLEVMIPEIGLQMWQLKVMLNGGVTIPVISKASS